MQKSYEIPPHTYKSCCDRGITWPQGCIILAIRLLSVTSAKTCTSFLFAFNLSSAVFLSHAVTLPHLPRDHAELLPADY